MAVGSMAAMAGNSYFFQAVKEYAANRKPQEGGAEGAGGKTVAEFSEKEWDKLLERMDSYLEEYRKDLAHRKEEALEEQKERARSSISWQRPVQEWIGQAAMQGAGSYCRHFVEPAPEMPSKGGEDSGAPAMHVVTQYVSDEALQKILEDRGKAPYSAMADSTGRIVFQGVELQCDYENNRLCLGDVSNLQNCLSIPLEGGGCLVVNRDSMDALARCIGMFSPGDINRILRAISQDAKLRKMQHEIEEETSGAHLLEHQEEADSATLPEGKEGINSTELPEGQEKSDSATLLERQEGSASTTLLERQEGSASTTLLERQEGSASTTLPEHQEGSASTTLPEQKEEIKHESKR